MSDIDIPTTGLAEFIADLASKHRVRYVHTELDDLVLAAE